ncbi:MAG: AAA family ATPase [Sutterellaceae bacterium]|nr:AAA family ATPase [Sutterellaceae bacterium]
MQTSIPKLPLWRSTFSTLRFKREIYVDKTELIYRIVKDDAKIFLVRPRRFGKSLLVSAMESLFAHGLRDFKGLAIEKLWTDKTYPVVHLDFSEVREFSDEAAFSKKFEEILYVGFTSAGFTTGNEPLSIVRQLARWMKDLPPSSLVVLIDEYDSPLTACLDQPELFEKVRRILSDFFLMLKSKEGCLRFFFMTGITKFSNTNIFSAFNNLRDVSLEPEYGSLLGYTEEEIRNYFAPYVEVAAKSLNVTQEEVMEQLQKNYDGFCFDSQIKTHVYCPWSVLNFFYTPHLGFENYWYASGGTPTVLMKYFGMRSLLDLDIDGNEKTISLESLGSACRYDALDPLVLLTQTGYLTMRSRSEGGYVSLDYPNKEVAMSMARLYSMELLQGKRWHQAGKLFVADSLAKGMVTESIEQINFAFNMIDYQDYPIASESACRAYLQALLMGAALLPDVERHTAQGRSDLELNAGNYHWVFELKFAKNSADIDKLLKTGEEQVKTRHYGETLHGRELIRIVMVFSSQERQFVRWQQVSS